MKRFIYFSVIFSGFFILCIVGCGENEQVEFLSSDPSDRSTISTDATITITFSSSPENLSVSLGSFSRDENTVNISGPFQLGEIELEITWEDGDHLLNYTVVTLGELQPIPEGMVLIPEGEFKINSVRAEAGIVGQPGHNVNVSGFYIDKYEVTNEQYKEFLVSNQDWTKENIDLKYHDGNYLDHWSGNDFPSEKSNHPVVYISWYAAIAYSEWVNKRLPTEAEWEKAARGGVDGRKYPWGNTIDDTKANYTLNVGVTGNTTPIGDYSENGFGLYDMVGNVLEWCIDEYDRDYFDDLSSDNPIGGQESVEQIITQYIKIKSSRSIRGGSWVESGQPRVWITYRRGNEPARTSHLIGFRCVKSISP